MLRGWEKMNAVLVKRPANQTKLLTIEEFGLFMLCDGETNMEAMPLDKRQRELLADYIKKGAVVQSETPCPITADQAYRFYPNRFVKSIFWSVTGRCNFRCRHCYMDAPEGALGELTHEEAIELIDQMAECGVLTVDITGGEPFVRQDLWEMIDRLLSYKITIGQVYTNGWLLTDAILDKFEERGLKPEFSISFDGIGWHDWMRGVTGAETAALHALKRCRERGFLTNVEMCIHKGNVDTIRETVNCLAQLGVPLMKCCSVAQTPLWCANAQGNDMSIPEYMEAMLNYLPYYYQDGMPMDLILGNLVRMNRGKPSYETTSEKYDGTENCLNCHLCGVVRYSCYITPEGRLLPCMPMTACKEQEQFARVQEIGLRKGLSDSYYMQFVDKRIKDLLAVNEECAACPYKYKCGGGCRATALEQTGNLLGPDPEKCFLFKNGYVEKIHQVADAAIAKYCSKEGDKQ